MLIPPVGWNDPLWLKYPPEAGYYWNYYWYQNCESMELVEVLGVSDKSFSYLPVSTGVRIPHHINYEDECRNESLWCRVIKPSPPTTFPKEGS